IERERALEQAEDGLAVDQAGLEEGEVVQGPRILRAGFEAGERGYGSAAVPGAVAQQREIARDAFVVRIGARCPLQERPGGGDLPVLLVFVGPADDRGFRILPERGERTKEPFFGCLRVAAAAVQDREVEHRRVIAGGKLERFLEGLLRSRSEERRVGKE